MKKNILKISAAFLLGIVIGAAGMYLTVNKPAAKILIAGSEEIIQSSVF